MNKIQNGAALIWLQIPMLDILYCTLELCGFSFTMASGHFEIIPHSPCSILYFIHII